MKLPPKQKIHEALSALADGRVAVTGNTASVFSSKHRREYKIVWDGDMFSSTDNASYWQGYPGYPIIAVLMRLGRLTYNESFAEPFAGIDWNSLNKQYGRDYEKVAVQIMQDLKQQGFDTGKIDVYIDRVYEQLGTLDLIIGRKAGRPSQ